MSTKVCYDTVFPNPPELTSPVYTTDPAQINAFITKAEALWNWIIAIYKDDDTDIGTWKHFIKELKENCGKVSDWVTGNKPYDKGDLVKNTHGMWYSTGDNNNIEPSIAGVITPDNWALMGDLRQVAVMECMTITVTTDAQLNNACAYASNKKLKCDLTIDITANITTSSPLKITGTTGGQYKVILKGNGKTITSSAPIILEVQNATVELNVITLKGDGTNRGLQISSGGQVISTADKLIVRECLYGIYCRQSGNLDGAKVTIANTRYGVMCINGGTIEITELVAYTNQANAVGIYAVGNGSVSIPSCKLRDMKIAIWCGEGSMVNCQDSLLYNTTETNIYCYLSSVVHAQNTTLRHGTYGIKCYQGSTVGIESGDMTGGSTKLIHCSQNSMVNMTSAHGSGAVLIDIFGIVQAKSATGFTYSQGVNVFDKDGCVYS